MSFEIWNETDDFISLRIPHRVLTMETVQDLYDDGCLYVSSYPLSDDETIVIAKKVSKQ